MPTVTSAISRPSSGCHVRSRWSSSSCGSRRLTARIIISDVLGDRVGEDAAGVGDGEAALERRRASARARRRPSPSGPSSAAGSGPGVGRRRRAAADRAAAPRRRDRSPSARPSSETLTRRLPGAAAAMRSRSLLAVARREDRRQPDRGRHAVGPASPGPLDARHRCGSRQRCTLTSPMAADGLRHDAPHPRLGVGHLGLARQRLTGRSRARSTACRPPAAATPATNFSPRRYCSSLRSSPVRRATSRSIVPRRWLRRTSKRVPDRRDVRAAARRRPRP